MEEGLSGFYIKGGNIGGNGNGRSSGSTTTTTNSGGTKCGRWNPTSEQVKVLTELFRSGLRTPSTDQIQKISTQLSFYGKIESKNVFYWFQNHKARERQKRRKVSTTTAFESHTANTNHSISPKNETPINTHSSMQYFAEINQGYEGDQRVIETLELFPLNNSFGESETEKLRMHAKEGKENALFSYSSIGEEINHVPLDLRLSFL